jgi:hypothetical protein
MNEVIQGSKHQGVYLGEVRGLTIFLNVLTWIVGAW